MCWYLLDGGEDEVGLRGSPEPGPEAEEEVEPGWLERVYRTWGQTEQFLDNFSLIPSISMHLSICTSPEETRSKRK